MNKRLIQKLDKYIEDNYISIEYDLCESAKSCEDTFKEFEIGPSFQEVLFRFIDTKCLDEVVVYKKADIDRKLFSKIRSNEDYNPRKSTVIKLIFGLELDLNESQYLLNCAGYSLSHSIKKDVIIEWFIINKIYNISELHQMLYEHNEKL